MRVFNKFSSRFCNSCNHFAPPSYSIVIREGTPDNNNSESRISEVKMVYKGKENQKCHSRAQHKRGTVNCAPYKLAN